MINKNILISIIMPALNSEKIIGNALKSLKEQNFNQDLLEVLVIDGGSTDKTREIAKQYGAIIIENPEVTPEDGLFHGYQVARGKYWAIMATDEVLLSKTSLKDRYELLESGKTNNIVTAGLKTPNDYPRVSRYINSLGDPFSFFIYRLDSENYYESLTKRYEYNELCQGAVITFNEKDTLPIVDGAQTFNSIEMKRIFGKITLEKVPLVFYAMAGESHSLGIVKGDYLLHYSGSNVRQLYKKTAWRVRNNVLNPDSPNAGFNNRARNNRFLSWKKYFFLPYAISIVLPLIDSICLSIKKNDVVFMHHVILTEYVLILLVYYYALKFLGITREAGIYGK